MRAHYKRIRCPAGVCWVADQADPIGVVEFYGGEVFGFFPTFWYQYLLHYLFEQRYIIIAVPVAIKLNHYAIAEQLLDVRDYVRTVLRAMHPTISDLPHFWLGHSVGCKIILLLEALTDPQTHMFTRPDLPHKAPRPGILYEPSLLIAPVIAPTSAAIPFPSLARLLDKLGLGVRPSMQETHRLIDQSDLFNGTAVIEMANDTLAGNVTEPRSKSTVAWLVHTFRRHHANVVVNEPALKGGHLEPIGYAFATFLWTLSSSTGCITRHMPRPIDQLALAYLQQLRARRTGACRSETTQANQPIVRRKPMTDRVVPLLNCSLQAMPSQGGGSAHVIQ